ncbi:MAG: hypothetical protein A2788_00405 [Candidatus Abawacabacteria bacterium RIFCSPHIGHO2_01_FULL_46_8]|uniref:DUF881 domain-containing protein n=1 Tax=Candidatus Abawacabacteria bacterium RIFCSPHIGHO2_01_FULL_46_8 TaxID=1817815 RepID=A0A1F4XM63_9BACT|nr:MAG: hypothetical protein A2788_00405 [Candidatus Abawacabacteria bacterium RIFCSPHIGHO2_01_FULL_46_8]
MPNSIKHFVLFLLGISIAILGSAVVAVSPLARPTLGPAEPYQELTASLSELQTEKTVLEDQVASLRRQLKVAETDALIARSELQKLHNLEEEVGLTAKKGAGVIIALEDVPGGALSTEVPEEVCHAANLRDIINLLRLAGAEAISINEQRILLSSTTICIDNGILINNTKSLSPFIIKAIGDPDTLRDFLTTKSYLPQIQQRKDQGSLKFEINTSADLVITEFKGQLTTKEVRLAKTK